MELREIVAGYDKGDGPGHFVHGARHFIDFPRMVHTIDGVKGRDLRD